MIVHLLQEDIPLRSGARKDLLRLYRAGDIGTLKEDERIMQGGDLLKTVHAVPVPRAAAHGDMTTRGKSCERRIHANGCTFRDPIHQEDVDGGLPAPIFPAQCGGYLRKQGINDTLARLPQGSKRRPIILFFGQKNAFVPIFLDQAPPFNCGAEPRTPAAAAPVRCAYERG